MHQRIRNFSAIILVIVPVLLAGCSLNITTQKFVHQDDGVEPLRFEEMRRELDGSLDQYTLEPVHITTMDGARLGGIRFGIPDAVANVVLYGGNGMTIGSSFRILERFAEVPVNVLWFDYRGSGASNRNGELQLGQLKRDAGQVLEHAGEAFENDLPVVVHGLSMGSLLAGHLAAERRIDALVLDSAISTVPALIENMRPFFVSITIEPTLAGVDNRKQLEKYQGPLLLMVGEEDDVTPVRFSRELLEASKSEPKSLVILADQEHGYSLKTDRAITEYREFLRKLGAARVSPGS